MFNWFRKNKIMSHLPSFLVEIEHTGNIKVSASWAKPTNPDELMQLVKGYVGTLLLLNEGKLTPLFQQAIAIYGESSGDGDSAKSVLMTMHNVLQENSPQKVDHNKPLISPTEAFRKG